MSLLALTAALTLAPAGSAAVAPAAVAPAARAEVPPERARELFLANCATCHGETGDGQGPTALDRPARSFRDGGFSFGNTPEALYRTITTGIPGTPMPGFAGALDDAERRAVAAYVRTLGPPVDDAAASDAELVVGERPLVVRGHLPPIVGGAADHPRGLLIGTPSGLSFEYRADDVRLLGVRQGGFVRRSDWTGRGGTPLEPLGLVVHLVEGGTPQPPYSLPSSSPSPLGELQDPGQPLVARLASTRVQDGVARVAYRLVDRDGRHVATGVEVPAPLAVAGGAGFARELVLQGTGVADALRLRVPGSAAATAVAAFPGRGGLRWTVLEREGAGFECVGVGLREGGRSLGSFARGDATYLDLPLAAERATELVLARLTLREWNDAARETLRAVEL